jgi:hypothetical protein
MGRGRSAPHPGQRPAVPPQPYGPPSGFGPAYDDAPGHTRAFAVHEAPDGYPGGQRADAYQHGGEYAGGHPRQEYADDGYVATYRAGQPSAPPAGPRLPWRALLAGILLRPNRTFWRMRDYQVWGPALLVTFGYGLLAVFGFDSARSDVLGESTGQSIPWVLFTAVAVVLSGIVTGAVTHTLARQFGGDGNWAPTIGLAMLITSLTDAPRLLFAIFLGGANGFVQIVGWVTWLACAVLLTLMVSTSHDLRWPKALGASAIQLVALLVLFKLPTL